MCLCSLSDYADAAETFSLSIASNSTVAASVCVSVLLPSIKCVNDGPAAIFEPCTAGILWSFSSHRIDSIRTKTFFVSFSSMSCVEMWQQAGKHV